MGSEVWRDWRSKLFELGLGAEIVHEMCSRKFRFGDQAILEAKEIVTFPVTVYGEKKLLTVFIVPGKTPFSHRTPLLRAMGHGG